MNRRTTLLALAAAVPAALASRIAGATSSAEIAPGSWHAQTLQYGTLAKLTSLIALERSASPLVQDFAKGEILEQTAFAQALTAMQNPPNAMLTKAQDAMLASVRDAPDSELDMKYLSVQHTGHETLLKLQDALLADKYPFTSRDVQQALVARAFIQNHLIALNLLIASNQ